MVIAWVMARHLSSWPWLSGSPYICLPAPQPARPAVWTALPPRFSHLGTCSLARAHPKAGGRAGGLELKVQSGYYYARILFTWPTPSRAVIAVDLQSDRRGGCIWLLHFVSTFVSRYTNDINQYCSGNFLPLPYADEPLVARHLGQCPPWCAVRW